MFQIGGKVGMKGRPGSAGLQIGGQGAKDVVRVTESATPRVVGKMNRHFRELNRDTCSSRAPYLHSYGTMAGRVPI